MVSQIQLLCCLLTLTLLCSKLYVDAASFTSPSIDEDKFVTQGRTATFTFSYTVENPQLLTIILCGYRSTTPDWIVSKTGLQTSVILPKYTARAQRGVDSTNQIGFSLLNVQLSDAGNIGCQMIYNGNALYSQLFRLKIYEAPRFGFCLPVVGNKFILREGQTFNSTCSFYGNPQPSLTCSILNQGRQPIQTPFPTDTQSNYTQQNPLIISNIQRAAKFAKCTATHSITGSKEVEREVLVYYLPTVPLELRRESTERSIKVFWKAPSENGNTNIISYLLEIEDTRTFVRNATNVTITGSFPRLEHTFNFLQPQVDYRISISAYNLVGKGATATATYKTVPYSPPGTGERKGSTNVGAIVGGVIGGIVFIVIIVAVAVYCSRRESKGTKKYPSSFVEEAVDYPAANSNMYSKVNKKKIPTSLEEDSTSGYPDIIHQANTNQRSNKPENKMLRAGSNEDNSTSPSYESSRKEYV